MAKAPLNEGDSRVTDLPPGATMIEWREQGIHFLKIEMNGVIRSCVRVKDYPSWSRAFDAAMDKAGL